jgi:hypothetical protein
MRVFQISGDKLWPSPSLRNVLLAVTELLLVLPYAAAATPGGSVGGIVRDESGGLVAEVKVVLSEKSKRLVHTSETANTGSFLFPSVLAGAYTLYAEKPGFRAYEVDDLTVEVGSHSFWLRFRYHEAVRLLTELCSPFRSRL